jgi:hypothetical protein
MQKPLSVHPGDFITTHVVQARGNIVRCESCHRLQSFCAACHERAGVGRDSDPTFNPSDHNVHPNREVFVENPGPLHHGIQAARDIKQCISCHREETCLQCHSERHASDVLENPHPTGFANVCRQMAAKNDRACLKCHTPDRLTALGCR